jgi:hypothetical protein
MVVLCWARIRDDLYGGPQPALSVDEPDAAKVGMLACVLTLVFPVNVCYGLPKGEDHARSFESQT